MKGETCINLWGVNGYIYIYCLNGIFTTKKKII